MEKNKDQKNAKGREEWDGKRRTRKKRRMRKVAQRIRIRKNIIMRGIRVYRIRLIGWEGRERWKRERMRQWGEGGEEEIILNGNW